MFELKHLRSLATLRDSGSLAAAAEALHLSQSALSHQLLELEQRLGGPLFIRKSRPVRFTGPGALLLRLADEVLPSIAAACRALQTGARLVPGPLRLAIECHSCLHWLLPVLTDEEVELVAGQLFEPQQGLLEGELDLVLTADPQPTGGIRYAPLFDFEMRLLLPPAHPLAQQTGISPRELASQTLLAYPVPAERLDVIRHFLQPAGLSPARIRVGDNSQMLMQMVAAGWGLAVLPSWVSAEYERQGLVVSRSLGEGLWRRLYGGMPAGPRQPGGQERLLARIRQQAQSLPGVRPLAS